MHELLTVILITVLAVISPGPDFAMITRNSYSFGRKAGLASALGIALGVQIHVFYTAFGIAALIMGSPLLFMAVKIVGAAYLIYLGINAIISRSSLDSPIDVAFSISHWQAFKMGVLTNALNPKTMLFVIATYTQAVQPHSEPHVYVLYGLFISASHWLWFSTVALFFSSEILRKRMLAHRRTLDRMIGIALIMLGGSLVLPELLAM